MARYSSRQPAFIKILFWNCLGLKDIPKRREFHQALLDECIDVALLQETLLNPGDRLVFPNYDVIRVDRLTGRGGGLAVLVKRGIDYHRSSNAEMQSIEAASVVINMAGGIPLKITSVYVRCGSRLREADLEVLLDCSGPLIAAGDYNCKHRAWHSRLNSTCGVRLYNHVMRNGCLIHSTEEPTHHPFNHLQAPDVIDFAISRNCRFRVTSRVMYDISSDHLPVILEVGNEHNLEEQTPSRKRVDWELYKSLLREFPSIPIIIDDNGIDAAQAEWTSFVQNALQRAAVHPAQRPGRPFLPADIRQKISDKRSAIKQAKRSCHPDDIRRATNLVHEVRNALHELRNEQWNEFLMGMLDASAPLWKVAKALRNGKREKLPHIHGPRGMAFTTSDKVEVFADAMENQFSPNYDLDNDLDEERQIVRSVRRYFRANGGDGDNASVGGSSFEDTSSEDSSTEALHSTTEELPMIPHCTPAELLGHIKDLKVRKAPGEDQITNKALKLLPPKAVTYLVAIINAMLRTQYFPKAWKVAEVIMIPKKAGSIFPQDYRPISLLSAPSKLAEKVILHHLDNFSSDHNVIPDVQFGFRSEHSTELQAVRLVERITGGFTEDKSTGVLLLDVSKAFDKVWHEGLLYKLIQKGFPFWLLKLLKSFLEGRKFRIKIDNVLSTIRPVKAGVPQGSVLGPILYSFFIHDVPSPSNCEVYLYADDTALVAQSWSSNLVHDRLQTAVDEVLEWADRWLIKINHSKTQAIYCTKKRRGTPPEVSINGTPLRWSSSVKYLGVTLDKGMTWRNHTEMLKTKFQITFRQFYPLLCRTSKLSLVNKIRLYKIIIRPAITYACAAWCFIAKTHMRALQVLQSRILRTITNAPWYVSNETLHKDLDIPYLKDYIKTQAQRRYEQAESHSNPLLRDSVDYTVEQVRKHSRPRLAL
ncbi:unnamed protein product [Callosobruchus maculatus]|uniref:Reverse transcriptase domain-containing protein n=1 Tax=Callosobruchus maculatus TaxID=64391 RepID=A0A653DWE6_CALMS|nr:unnamed protein product [Callosobruchus maculatus]